MISFLRTKTKPKIIAVVGPTSSGKSSLAVEVAKRFNGEVVSADSRQIYKELDIGTGMISKEEMGGIPHHLLGFLTPDEEFSVAVYKEKAEAAIDDILSRDKLPVVCGGTGFYIEAITRGIVPPEVKPDLELREKLSKLSLKELYSKLEELDLNRAKNIQKENKRRLIRAIEIATHLGEVPEINPNPKYEALQIGLSLPKEELREKIDERVQERLEEGWVEEVAHLLDAGISKEKIREFGLGYKIIADYLKTEVYEDKKSLADKITSAEWRYAKRQRLWFKRDESIKWFSPEDKNKIFKAVEQFLI